MYSINMLSNPHPTPTHTHTHSPPELNHSQVIQKTWPWLPDLHPNMERHPPLRWQGIVKHGNPA